MCIVDSNEMNDERVSITNSNRISSKTDLSLSKEDTTIYDLGIHLPSPSPKVRMKKIMKAPGIKLKKGFSKIMKKIPNETLPSTRCELESRGQEEINHKETNDNSSPWSNILSFIMCEGNMSQIFDRTYTTKIPVPSYRNETEIWKGSTLLQEYTDQEKSTFKSSSYSVQKEDEKVRIPIKRSCCGPKLGSFVHTASESNVQHEEILDTYINFRADEFSTDIFKQMKCSIPLYHNFSEMNIQTEIKHACSEPLARSFEVRGPTYLLNSKKESSDETMFALLGVDNIVKKKGDQSYIEDDVCRGSNSYFERLKCTTEQMGVDMPFILVVNFVVPWGNLLAYFYRPDSGNGGPTNDTRISIPSEKLWNEFLNGDEELRNNTLKFIVSSFCSQLFQSKF
jgi:hypothetical protein